MPYRNLLKLFISALIFKSSFAFAAQPQAKYQLNSRGTALKISVSAIKNNKCQGKIFVQSNSRSSNSKKNAVEIPLFSNLKFSLKELSRIRGRYSQTAYIRTNFTCENGRKYSDLDRVRIPASGSRKGYSSLRRWIQSVREKLEEAPALSPVATPEPTAVPQLPFPPQNLKLVEAFPNLNFNSPVDMQEPGDGTDNLYVVEQGGIIQKFANSNTTSDKAVFLDITSKVKSGGEQGLLGLAFHPAFEQNGYFFVNYTRETDGATVVARYAYSGTLPVDPASEVVILTISQPYSNHNGGSIHFGPDNFLYVAMGDGGSSGDPQNNAQNLQSLLGKILRIDINNFRSGIANYSIPSDNPFASASDGANDEIYAYGFRNPWKISFDSNTGILWAADVGQGAHEEVNIVQKGRNYGWDRMEGFACYPSGNSCDKSGLTLPVVDYPRSEGQSVTGGYVYRGNQIPELNGVYLYGDFISGRIWGIRGLNPLEHSLLIQSSNSISSFGRDRNGEVFVVDIGGKIFKFAR